MTISHDDLVDLWGEPGIVRLTPAGAAALGLPEALVHLGLPREVGYLFAASDPPTRVDDRLVRLGWGWHGESAMCVTGPGAVVAVTGGTEEVPVNRGVVEFIEFLYRIDRFWIGAEDLDTGAYTALAGDLAADLGEVDPAALEPGGWWSGIVEELKIGMI